ncbi:nitroreductase family protein [Robiginitalea sp. IMCC43444]|uniref:nitroreductase family protein n=1 Tax=Robiginitalea sp. IMCC43444 TaxID=3459121 RepID=UPI004040F9FC
MEKSVTEAIQYRRAVRVFKKKAVDPEIIRLCLENSILAPSSSNLQLWEFVHVSSETARTQFVEYCFGQNAAKTADQLVVVVVRKDLWKKRSRANLNFLKEVYGETKPEKMSKRQRFALNYYRKLIPSIYMEFLGVLGWLRYLLFNILGLFRPVYRQVRLSDMRIVAHKSAALAAQNFMISMAARGLDTCPMEGSDTLRIKRFLKLPRTAEINMVIGCGYREETGVYGPRFRVPFEEVYSTV